MTHNFVLAARVAVDTKWKNGKLMEAKIIFRLDEKAKVRYAEKTIELETKKGKTYRFDENLIAR